MLDPARSFLLQSEYAIPVLRRRLGLEMRDPMFIEIVYRGKVSQHGQTAAVKQAQRGTPFLVPVGGQQCLMLLQSFLCGNFFRRDGINAAGLSLALDRDDIDLDQARDRRAGSAVSSPMITSSPYTLPRLSSREARLTGSPSSE